MAAPRVIEFFNDSGKIIPSFAVMEIKGTVQDLVRISDPSKTSKAGKKLVKVGQPSTKIQRYYLINGPFAVPINGRGTCDETYPKDILYDDTTSGGDAIIGEEYGPVPGTWKLGIARNGFTVIDSLPSVIVGGPFFPNIDTSPQGLKRSVFLQRQVTEFLGILTSDLLSLSSATAQVQYGVPGVMGPAGFDDVTVADWMIPGGLKIPSGSNGVATYMNGTWWWTAAGACPQ